MTMIKVEKNNTLYAFYEEFEYNKNNPEESLFGFNIWINFEGIPDFIYMVVKKKVQCKNITNGWEREYKYKDGILTQSYKTKKNVNNTHVTETEISEEKMKDIMEAMWNVYQEDWPKVIAKRQEMANKVSKTKTINNSEIPF